MPRYRATIGESVFDLDVNDGKILVNGDNTDVDIVDLGNGRIHVLVQGEGSTTFSIDNMDGSVDVMVDGSTTTVQLQTERDLLLEKYGMSSSDAASHTNLKAPMPGLVVRIDVAVGDTVSKGDPLLVLEAMKMENEIKAAADGKVARIHVKAGDPVAKGDLLLEFEG